MVLFTFTTLSFTYIRLIYKNLYFNVEATDLLVYSDV